LHVRSYCSVLQCDLTSSCRGLHLTSVLQCVAGCCSCNTPHKPSCWSSHLSGAKQCIAVCCSMLQYVALCCSVLQCIAVYCSVLQLQHITQLIMPRLTVTSSLWCVAVCCSVLRCVEVVTYHSTHHAETHFRLMRCSWVSSVLQCVAAYCSILHLLHTTQLIIRGLHDAAYRIHSKRGPRRMTYTQRVTSDSNTRQVMIYTSVAHDTFA